MAIFCLGPAATGTGSGADWNNLASWATISFFRTNVYYLAAGSTYIARTLSTATNGTQTITVKRATVADHGPATGWLDSMAVGSAVIKASLFLQSDYWIFDGQARTGRRTGYGIVIDNHTAPASISSCVALGDTSPSNAAHCTFRYVEVYGSGRTDGTILDAGFTTPFGGSANFLTCQFCWVHDIGQLPFQTRSTTDLLIEDCIIERNHSESGSHSEGIGLDHVSRAIIRRNEMSDIEGTAYISCPSGSTNVLADIEIYDNIFWTPNAPLRGGCGNGVLLCSDSVVTGKFRFYHNVIVNFRDAVVAGDPRPAYQNTSPSIFIGAGRSATLTEFLCENNLWVSCDTLDNPNIDVDAHITTFLWRNNASYSTTVFTGTGVSGNQVLGSMPLVNWTAGDFHLAFATTPGTALGAPYNVDFDGVTRTNYDRGAFEYVSGVVTPPFRLGFRIRTV